ncbi:MAG: dehydrogenase [Rhizobiales bacterium]|nr:dehydrogenase [Hyphomicrobiales bacterium]
MTPYRVALSADFLKPDGSPALDDFDLTPLRADPRVEIGYVEAVDDVIPAPALEHYDALILFAYQMRRLSLHANGRLGVVARFGVGYDSVDVEELANEGVATTITPGGVQRPVAVAILTLILALSTKLLAKDRLARRGVAGFTDPSAPIGMGLTGKRLGTIGLGNIGTDMVQIMRPLGLDFIAHDPGVSAERAKELGVRLVDLDTLFRESDIVTVNCPLMPGTRGLVDASRLAVMKKSAILINTARGPIVDQTALTGALRNGSIAGAGLDVFSPEPPSADDPLLQLDNVVLAPHSLAMTDELVRACGALTIESVLDVMQGREPKAIVQRRVTSHPAWTNRLAKNRIAFG